MPSTELVPAVSIQNGKPMTNSRDVAELFGKRHADVLRAMDRLECSAGFYERNYASVTFSFTNGRGGQQEGRSLDMTKDGFVFLVMGFTGRDAARFKEAYIQRFNEMEAELREIHRSSHLGNVTVHEFFLGEHRPAAMPSGS